MSDPPRNPPIKPPLNGAEVAIRDQLRRHVETLAGLIGPRSLRRPSSLAAAASYVERELRQIGYQTRDQVYRVGDDDVRNIDCERPGTDPSAGIYVVGAHYDTVPSTPGADDNASAVAGLLEIARAMVTRSPRATVRFAAFANEEPPYFQSPDMGSVVYADACRQRGDDIRGMICLEMIGYYDEAAGSQQYPPGIPALLRLALPRRGNFIGIVGNTASAKLVRAVRKHFRAAVRFPHRAVALPEAMGFIGLSDQWSFWRAGYPGVMITDTSMFRYAHYHLPTDTPDRLDYDRTARVVYGMSQVVAGLSGATGMGSHG